MIAIPRRSPRAISTPATMTSGALGLSAGGGVGLAAATGERELGALLGLAGTGLAVAVADEVAVGVTVREAVGDGVELALAAGVAFAAVVGDGEGDGEGDGDEPTNAQTLRVDESQAEPSAAVRETAARMKG